MVVVEGKVWKLEVVKEEVVEEEVMVVSENMARVNEGLAVVGLILQGGKVVLGGRGERGGGGGGVDI